MDLFLNLLFLDPTIPMSMELKIQEKVIENRFYSKRKEQWKQSHVLELGVKTPFHEKPGEKMLRADDECQHEF